MRNLIYKICLCHNIVEILLKLAFYINQLIIERKELIVLPQCIFLYGNVFIYTFLKEILNNSINTNKTNNDFSPQLIEQKKTMTYYGVGNSDLGLGQA